MRERLHHYLDVADDRKVKAIYTMMEEAIAETAVSYTPELKAILDQRHKAYKEDPASRVSAAKSDQRIAAILKGKTR